MVKIAERFRQGVSSDFDLNFKMESPSASQSTIFYDYHALQVAVFDPISSKENVCEFKTDYISITYKRHEVSL